MSQMETFVMAALKKVRGLTARKHKDLRHACDEALARLKDSKARGSKVGPGNADVDADKYFLPFRLSCESRHAKIMGAALDCLQKLVAHGFLRGLGASVREPNVADRTLMDDIVTTICDCRDQPDDNVQLQVIKALLQCVGGSTCEVHGRST